MRIKIIILAILFGLLAGGSPRNILAQIEAIPTPTTEMAIPTLPIEIGPALPTGGSAQMRVAAKMFGEMRKSYLGEEKVELELVNKTNNKIEVEVKNPNDEVVEVVVETEQQGEISSLTINPPLQFKPGKYTMKIWDNLGLTVEEEFVWGVLALNTNKSVYLLGETAYLQMASLDSEGHTICRGNLELVINDEVLSTENGEIKYSESCRGDNVTDSPDYFAYYEVGATGSYQMTLKNLDNGYEINDSFEVKESIPFEIERTAATRINPFKADYVMKFKVKANEDFVGMVTDDVPVSFILNSPNSWQVDWKKGETYEFSYEYNAPDISPWHYFLGPLVLSSDLAPGDILFQESRRWQIAADAVTVTIVAVGTSQWVAPDDVYLVEVQAWGGGGGGGDGTNGRGGGGGGGGAYVWGTMPVIPGNTYPVVVGSGGSHATSNNSAGENGGDSSFNTNSILAAGGNGGGALSGSAGGQDSASIGSTKYSGGDGGTENTSSDGGGGGGGAAGIHGVGITGGDANTSIGGSGGTGDNGSGGAGGYNVNAQNGTNGADNALGGGGGGGGDNGLRGGNGGSPGGGGGGGEVNSTGTVADGGNGQVILTYTANPPPNTPSNTTPGNGATDVSTSPTLTASAYSDNEGDAQNASQWQVATDSGFTSVVRDTGTTGPATNTVNISPPLSGTTVYFWKVRYQAVQGNWSAYSIGTSFTTTTAASGPTMDQVMRHGGWFSNGVRQPFSF